jgi:uncharacterized protein YggE
MTATPIALRSAVEGLTVVGMAAREAPPEIVELSFEIHSVGLTAAIALQENATKATYVGQALSAMGNAVTDVKTGGIEVLPIQQLPNPSSAMAPNSLLLPAAFGLLGSTAPVVTAVSENPSSIGYRAVTSIKVVVRDLNRVGEAVDTAIRAGAIPNGNIRFLLQDEATLERTLLEEAVRRATEKAAVLATAVGRSTGTPISISEEFTAYQPQQFYGNGRHNPYLMPMAGSNVRPALLQGQITFCARVNVVYQFK